MWPLCRIFSISLADLQTIAMIPFSRVMIFENTEDLSRHVVHGLIAIYADQSARPLVIICDWTRLLLKCRKSWLNHFQPVVVAGFQFGRVGLVAQLIHAGPLQVDVIDPSTGGTRTSSSNPEQ